MKYASIGIRVALASRRTDRGSGRNGFTLVEALVALSLLLVFALALSPILSHARRLLARGGGEIRAELLLRALLQAPLELADLQDSTREGDNAGFHWRTVVTPIDSAPLQQPSLDGGKPSKSPPLYKVSARVFWGAGSTVAAETLRLGGDSQ
jgi:prepilin-type N-terminal cleavage/methylation domain-containing protein